MSDILYSIITICKNNASGLRLTGKSILQQLNTSPYEWLIVDGGSTDNTLDLIRDWHSDTVRFVSKPDRNKPHAMNIGLTRATGQYVLFLHAGDCLSDAYVLRDIAREIRMNPIPDILYGDARDKGIIHKARDFSSLMQRPVTPHQAVLYRRQLIGELRFDEDYPVASDYAFLLKFQEKANRIHYMPRLICDIEDKPVLRDNRIVTLQEQHRIRHDMLHTHPWKNALIHRWHMLQLAVETKWPALFAYYHRKKTKR